MNNKIKLHILGVPMLIGHCILRKAVSKEYLDKRSGKKNVDGRLQIKLEKDKR